MKPSELIKELEVYMKWCGDKDVYILSKIDNRGTHVGRIISIGADVEDGIIIETDIESVSCTT